jgi:peroxiredoxin Q/BCP
LQEIETLGAVVCGVSVDDSEGLARFAARNRLPFVLLSDRNGVVAARFGSLVNLGFWKFARRNTFLINPQGRIAKVYLSVNPSKNSQQVIEDLQGLRKP